MRKIRKNDDVIVITGRDKGKQGKVIRVITVKNRIVVENVNVLKRHTKPNMRTNEPGGILEKEMSIHISNVALVNPSTGKADRVTFKTLEDGKKVRCFKSNGEVVKADL
jgi:large subunit ribosomal protein L24